MKKKAEDSNAIKRARRKLKEQMKKEEKLLGSSAVLNRMKKVIRNRLSRKSRVHISLKDKNVSLFDANKHSAPIKSKAVLELVQKIKKEK